MKLSATTRALDHHRALRLLIAWATGDRYACDTVLREVMNDPVGTPGLIFAMAEFITQLGLQGDPDFADQLRQLLVHDAASDDGHDTEDDQ